MINSNTIITQQCGADYSYYAKNAVPGRIFFFFFFVVDTDFFFTLAREDGEAGDRAHNMPLRAVFAGWTLKHTMALTDAHLLVKFFRVLLPVKN